MIVPADLDRRFRDAAAQSGMLDAACRAASGLESSATAIWS